MDATCYGGHIVSNPTRTKPNQQFIGAEFETNNHGCLVVLSKTDKSSGTAPKYLVEFTQTGFRTSAIKSRIKKGGIRDPYYPSVCGVACTGQTPARVDGKQKPDHKRWMHMIDRCYNQDHPSFNHYGARGISVCDRWLCFEVFEQDVKTLPGYDDPEKYTIDRIDNDGDYNPGNCRFATMSEQVNNQRDRRSNQKTFIAISPDGEKFRAFNQREFSREHGLNYKNVNSCLRGRKNSHHGWRFRYLEDHTTGGGNRD